MAKNTKPILLNETGQAIKEELKGLKEKAIVMQGPKGDPGEPGPAGETPIITIGENGNWFINGEDTGISAKGPKGDPGMTEAEMKAYIDQYISENYENANEGAY